MHEDGEISPLDGSSLKNKQSDSQPSATDQITNGPQVII